MIRQLFTFAGLATLLLGPGPGLAGAAQPVEGRPRMVQVDVDTSELEPARGARLDRAITEELGKQLATAGFVVIATKYPESRVLAHVRLTDETAMTYSLSYDLFVADEQQLALVQGSCEVCTESALVTFAGDQMKLVITALQGTADAEKEAELAPEVVPAPEVDKVPGLRLGPIAYAGVGVAGAGVIALIVGGVIYARPERRTRVDETLTIVDQDKPGIAWMGIGATAVVLGGAAVALDMLLFQPARARRVSVGAMVSPRQVGLQLRGRF